MDTNTRQLNKTELRYVFQQVAEEIPHLDLQHEIVDHLATGIEAQWQVDESIPLEAALRVEIMQYPVTGFYQIVQARTKAINAYWKKEVRNNALQHILHIKNALVIGFIAALIYFLWKFNELPNFIILHDVERAFTVGTSIFVAGMFVSFRDTANPKSILALQHMHIEIRWFLSLFLAWIAEIFIFLPSLVMTIMPDIEWPALVDPILYCILFSALYIWISLVFFLEGPFKKECVELLNAKYALY